MDLILVDSAPSAQCYKCNQKVFDNLIIEVNTLNSMVVLWNKYQIFIYEFFRFESASKIIIPEYLIHRLLFSTGYIVCLDTNGFVHVTPLESKDPTQKQLECTSSYQPREQGVKAIVFYNQELTLSLKKESESYFLSINEISSDFKEVKKVALHLKEPWPILESSKEKYYLTYGKVDETHFRTFQKMFNVDNLSTNSNLIVLSFDKYVVYGCLFDPNIIEDETNLLKLYSCPSEICSIEMIGRENKYIQISLKMGTIIELSLNALYTSSTATKITPVITHLNTALQKLAVSNNIFIYIDGVTMFKAECLPNMTFQEFIVKNVYDFVLCGDLIICTTFNKMIYMVSHKNETSYIKREDKGYTPADELVGNSKYMKCLFEEVERAKLLTKQFRLEFSYVAALSLSKRPDIMDKIIQCSAQIFGSFDEAMKKSRVKLNLTEDVSRYFEPDVYLLFISINITPYYANKSASPDSFSDILRNCDSELHITLSNDNKTLLQTSVKVDKSNFIIPFQLEGSTEINVDIKLVSIVPGAYDIKQKIWIEQYKKKIKFTSEHFIRADVNESFSILNPKADLGTLILNIPKDEHKNQFEITDISTHEREYSMYIQLPENFNLIEFSKTCFKKSESMSQVLKSKQTSFKVDQESVSLELEKDGFTNPRFKVTSKNFKITFYIRNFLANILFGDKKCWPNRDYINHSFYTTVENLQRAVSDCITTSASINVFLPLMEQFEKEVISTLPV